MARSKVNSDAVTQLPIADLVRRAFRAGSFFPLLALAVLLAVGIPARQVVQATSQAENYAEVLEGRLSDRLAIFVDRTERVSLLLARSDGGVSTVARLDQFVTLDPAIMSAVAINSTGRITASTSGRGPSQGGVLEEALSWTREKGTPFIGVPAFDSTLRARAMIIAVPVSSALGEAKGMLQVTVSTDWMLAAIARTKVNLGVNTFVADQQGTIVAHGDEWRVLAGQSLDEVGSGLLRDMDGTRTIIGAVPARGWNGELVAISSLPIADILPAAAIGLLPVLFILIAFFASRRARHQLVRSVVAPIHELGSRVATYGPEHLEMRIDETDIEEINVVANAFNATADRMDTLVASLKESSARFQKLFDAAPVGMALHSIDGRYVDTNEVYDKLFGFTDGRLSLGKVLELVVPESQETVRSGFAAIARREVETITFDGGFVSASGKPIWAIVTATVLPQQDGAMDQVVAQVVDVTELKEAQSKLEDLLVSKNKFLAAVSHELRTPLTAVIGLAELLRDPESALSSEQRTSLINTIVDSGFDVSNMVEDLLTAARQEAGQLSVVAVPVNILAQTKQAIEVLGQNTDISIVGESSPALADPGRVRQILRNLLTNALKYGGGRITVVLGTSGGFAVASVVDDGPGVPFDSSELIFQSYERAHGMESHPGSVGIGLSISRELSRQMGGDLVYRRSGGRTHFDLTIPLLDEYASGASTNNRAALSI